ncbi:MAG: hypothetical protein ACRYGP_08240 [Janthinobacterium lividum]
MTEMADLPADDRAGLDLKASALLFADAYEVQEGWRLARSLATDTLRLDALEIERSRSLMKQGDVGGL